MAPYSCSNTSAASAKVEKALGASGRLLVRWSGTEPKLRILVEGEDTDRIAAYAKDLSEAAKKDVLARGLNGKNGKPEARPRRREAERRGTTSR